MDAHREISEDDLDVTDDLCDDVFASKREAFLTGRAKGRADGGEATARDIMLLLAAANRAMGQAADSMPPASELTDEQRAELRAALADLKQASDAMSSRSRTGKRQA